MKFALIILGHQIPYPKLKLIKLKKETEYLKLSPINKSRVES